uniref:Uncharacterized protein n=1 Tax=Rhizophora mucronata TaxID=61149 RepID=A0A2P2QHD0_RHIMU
MTPHLLNPVSQVSVLH